MNIIPCTVGERLNEHIEEAVMTPAPDRRMKSATRIVLEAVALVVALVAAYWLETTLLHTQGTFWSHVAFAAVYLSVRGVVFWRRSDPDAVPAIRH